MVLRFLACTTLAAFSGLLAQAAPQPDPCVIKNVCYALDQSGSVSDALYASEQSVAIKFASAVDSRSSGSTANSVVAFSTKAETILSPTTNFDEFEAAVLIDRIFRGNTFLSNGITQCTKELKNADGNKVMVIITDGETAKTDIASAKSSASMAKELGIDIVTIRVGPGVSGEAFLREIASDPSLFINSNTEYFEKRISEVLSTVCDPVITNLKCENAFEQCEFTFFGKQGLRTFSVSGKPDRAFTPRIVPKHGNYFLRSMNTNDIIPEFIDDKGVATEINKLGQPEFTPTHFKPYWIGEVRGSGIGHQTFHGNQEDVAKGKCIRIYFTHFQEKRRSGHVNRNNVPRSENKCVVFRTI